MRIAESVMTEIELTMTEYRLFRRATQRSRV